ncbi:MAG: LysM peptidoglycan-binding domain-containing protein [Ardenticatenaceae bacterium]|nr:LysM peptidoglycan-binding domain-containing protein [Ardenticatenaceae bacterium]MCB8946603.1 LysM peptidoglycan-binding domain-containing protein [Ardenticatenaceae bacterium]
MRKYLFFVLLLILATVGCAQLQNNGASNNNNDESAQETAEEEAPRVEVTATPTLPPTYTPGPMGVGGHISPVETRAIHIVQAGETMGQIAAQYDVDTKFLADSNRIYNYNLIYVGQVLYIPPCE